MEVFITTAVRTSSPTYCTTQNSQWHSLQFLMLTYDWFINSILPEHKIHSIKQGKFIFHQHNNAQYWITTKSVKQIVAWVSSTQASVWGQIPHFSLHIGSTSQHRHLFANSQVHISLLLQKLTATLLPHSWQKKTNVALTRIISLTKAQTEFLSLPPQLNHMAILFGNLNLHTSTLKTEAACSSEMSVCTYKISVSEPRRPKSKEIRLL